MSSAEKQWIDTSWPSKHDSDHTFDIDRPIEDLIAHLQRAQLAVASGAWRNVRLEWDEDYDGYRTAVFEGARLETDAEVAIRLQRDAANEKHALAQQRAEYERLKKLFESK